VDAVEAWITTHPYPQDGKPNLIMCGDINDFNQSDGVRKVALEYGGWKPLRKRLPLAKISGDTLRSFNGWRKTSSLVHDGRWIDEIFTSGITLEGAALRRTCTDIYRHCASDHNGVSADVITT
jgi:endonuclease/exonuclease/phosphatase family metal-dependent hydrolase